MSNEENIQQAYEDNKPESPPEIIIPLAEMRAIEVIGQPVTTNPKPETENMEVHHHPNLHHKPKKWKEYFLEFVMIFLAVTMGFFAESYRENLVEKSREKESIESFIEDLKSDTAAIKPQLSFLLEKRMVLLDSLMHLFESQKIKGYENSLYYFGRLLLRSQSFQSNDRTIKQLKNSGAFRLIRNKEAADSIISYDKLIETLNLNQANEREERKNTYPVVSQMFNPFVFDKMVRKDGIVRPTDNPSLNSYDPKLQQQLAFSIHNLKGSIYFITNILEALNVKAKNIIAFLKREYQLE